MFSVKGTLIYTGKDVIQNAYLNVKEQVIAEISTTPLGDVQGEYAVITPAFIDPHCHIGMHRAGEPSDEGEANEHIDSILPLVDALDSVQMDDTAFQDAVEAGVLYSCVVPGSGNILGGRSAVIRNYAKTSTDALIARAGIKAAMGYNPMSTREWKGKRPFTRMGAIALLREKLYAVNAKLEKQAKEENKDAGFSREDEILLDILYGKEVLRVHVHKIDDIESTLRLVDEINALRPEFKISMTVEHAGDVHDGYIFHKLKARGIPVIYGPVDSHPYKVELKHENWRHIKHLLASGVEFGLMTDHPVILQRMLLTQLRWFLRSGLSKQEAIQVLTRQNAKILKIDHILGTLEQEKWASFSCWNGDPFDLGCYPLAVYGEGDVLYSSTEGIIE